MKRLIPWCMLVLLISPLAAQAAYEAGAVPNGGKVAGKVTFQGAAPAPKKISITKDNAVCGTGEREVVEVAVQGGALQNAVVYLVQVDKGKAWGDLAQPLLDQKGCRFMPDALVVQKGVDLIIRNSDPVLHNIHTYEIIGAVRRTIFNVGQPDKGDMKQTVRMRRANVVKIECDAHDFMHAWAFTADNPYAAVTAADGSFAIDNVPPGKYEVKVWHPILGEKSANVDVAAGGSANTSFQFSR